MGFGECGKTDYANYEFQRAGCVSFWKACTRGEPVSHVSTKLPCAGLGNNFSSGGVPHSMFLSSMLLCDLSKP